MSLVKELEYAALCCQPGEERRALIERAASVVGAATELVALWQAQKIAGLPRAERNAAIEGVREKLIAALAE